MNHYDVCFIVPPPLITFLLAVAAVFGGYCLGRAHAASRARQRPTMIRNDFH